MRGGAKVWYFPDGNLPEKTPGANLEAHESLMLLNTGTTAAHLSLDFYFEDRDPIKDIPVTVGPKRIVCLRPDKRVGSLEIPPLTQYSIRVCSDASIVAQFGRLDATQPNLAYYGCMGCAEE